MIETQWLDGQHKVRAWLAEITPGWWDLEVYNESGRWVCDIDVTHCSIARIDRLARD